MPFFSRTLLVSFAALSLVSQARAQLPPPLPAPAEDPRKGPRLEYKRGPAQCLSEEDFRSDVAIWLDGIDHLATDAPDRVRVWFERSPGGFKGTVVYTNAAGEQSEPEVLARDNCENLGRWVAWVVSRRIPPPPDPPPPTPCPNPPAPACPACSCPACPECGTSRPQAPRPPPAKAPWRMDLSVGLNAYVAMTAYLSANVGPAFTLGGEVRGETLGIGAELRFVTPSVSYAREPLPGATQTYPQQFDLSQITALITPCARYKYFVGCGVGQLGAALMQTPIRLETSMTFGFGPRVGFEIPFGDRFSVFGFGEVLFSPIPVALYFTLPDPDFPDSTPANVGWTQSVASAFFGAGASIKFR